MHNCKSVFKYTITTFNDLKPYQNHFQESLKQEPRHLSRASLKMSTLYVQRDTQVKWPNNPVCHCDRQNKKPSARADLSDTPYIHNLWHYLSTLARIFPLKSYPVISNIVFDSMNRDKLVTED